MTVLSYRYWKAVIENQKLKRMIENCDQRMSALKKEMI